MTWEQRFGALVELDGDEWDAAHKRLEQAWLAAYTAAFVEIAVSRGWRREDAQTWPVGIGDEAFISLPLQLGPVAGGCGRRYRVRSTALTVRIGQGCCLRAALAAWGGLWVSRIRRRFSWRHYRGMRIGAEYWNIRRRLRPKRASQHPSLRRRTISSGFP